jgi:anti-sigma B factor antagonist
MKLHFSQKKDPKVHYLFMEGDLIGDEAGPRLAEMVSDSVEEGIKVIVIDLEKVRYISSSGLGLLITEATSLFQWGRLSTVLLVVIVLGVWFLSIFL